MARGTGRKNRAHGIFGSVDKLATGYRARYYGPDGRRRKAPTLFLTKGEARSWLALRHAEIIRQVWEPPKAQVRKTPRLTFAVYAEQWLAERELKTRTREHYRRLLDQHLLDVFGSLPLASITSDDVRTFHAGFGDKTPTARAHCYGLLRTVMGSAASDGLVTVNPCTLRGAGVAKRVHLIQPATLDELETITTKMPQKYRLMVLLASWCALRIGELCELRRPDIDLSQEVIRVRRAVVRTKDGFAITTPKSTAGVRDVAIPPHLIPAIEDHLSRFVGKGRDSLLFANISGKHLAPDTIYQPYYRAREAAGRPDLRFHDLRHSGAVLAAMSGATLAELMDRLGHSTPTAALIYQHAAKGRDREIAALLSKMADNRGP